MHFTWTLLRRAIDRLVGTLPLILLALLALGSYWLVRLAPVPKATAADQVKTHEADYFLNKFSVKTFTAEGKLKNELLGGAAKHFPDTDTTEVENIRINNFNEQGRLATITSADFAISNADNSEVQLQGNAKSIREAATDADGKRQPKLEITGEFLHTFVKEERIKSHLPVTLTRGVSVIQAGSLDYDNLSRVASLQGSVKAQIPATSNR